MVGRAALVPTVLRGNPYGGLNQTRSAFPFMPFRVRRSVGTRRAHGFSLLEMLLVLFLIGLMASAGLMLTEGVEDQAKYDETKRRMEMMRRAIVGDPTRTVNGGPEISGFVADMGRLPGCVAELLELKPDPVEEGKYLSPCDSQEIKLWQKDENTDIWAGWRGPYIAVLPERNGNIRFRDGYGNTGTDVGGLAGTNPDAPDTGEDERNSGWTWSLYQEDDMPTTNIANAATIRLQSYGTDGLDRYPSGTIGTVAKLIDESDYRADFANWNNFQLVFRSISTDVIEIPANRLRLKLSYPNNGVVNVWPANATDRDNVAYLSATFPAQNIFISNGSHPVTSGASVTVPDASTLNGNELFIGTTGKLVFSGPTSISVNANDILTVPSGSSLTGTTLSITQDGKVFFPPYKIDIGLQFPENLAPVTGQYSLVVVCDDTTNENSVSGQRFDGDCSKYGDDTAPLDHTPQTPPYLFEVTARSHRITPPSPFVWTIK
jgi:prepilin-type N-terminal cleavage/methylation domain-containing protein